MLPDPRTDRIASAFGQGLNPHDSIPDYGERDDDHSKAEQAQSWEHTDVDDQSRTYILYDRDAIDGKSSHNTN